MKRTILYLATLCALSLTGFAGSATTTAVTAPEIAKSNDQKTIDELRARVEKLELFATVMITEYPGNGELGTTMAYVIKLQRQGNRFADKWVKKKLADIDTSVSGQIAVANMYASYPDPDVRDKKQALHYAMLAYSQTTNLVVSPANDGHTNSPSAALAASKRQIQTYFILATSDKALEALAAAYAINGNFPKAIEAEEKAIAIASTGVVPGTIRARTNADYGEIFSAPMKKRLELYKKGLPFIEEEKNIIGHNIWEMSGLPQFESEP